MKKTIATEKNPFFFFFQEKKKVLHALFFLTSPQKSSCEFLLELL